MSAHAVPTRDVAALDQTLDDLLDRGWLDVGDGHRVAWSEHGCREGLPVVVLHGGPGSGSSLRHLAFFPLDRCRVILVDQRGCGHSTPLGATHANTTQALVDDVAALRKHLGIDAWLVVGGSWGATLAMAYAQVEARACKGVLLRAPFLASEADLDWFCIQAGRLRPEAYEHFTALPELVAASEPLTTSQVLQAYARAFAATDVSALNRWLLWEATLEQVFQVPTPSSIVPPPERLPALLARARIQLHYLLNRCFLNASELLQGLGALDGLPCAIVQGDMDWVCPPANGWAVHQAWPGSALHRVSQGTHSPFHGAMPAVMRELVCHFVAHACFPQAGECSIAEQALAGNVQAGT